MRSFNTIKPQDILIILKLSISPDLTQKELSEALNISQAEISHGLKRLKQSKLITLEGGVNLEACLEFLVHGLKYVFPPKLGPNSVGIPTAFARPGFKYIKYGKDDIYIWPHAKGKVKGISLTPLYEGVVEACHKDEELYSLVSLIEMIRVGRVREQKIAASELKDKMKAHYGR